MPNEVTTIAQMKELFHDHLMNIRALNNRIDELKAQKQSLTEEQNSLEDLKDATRNTIKKAMEERGLMALAITDNRNGRKVKFGLKQSNGKVSLQPGVSLDDVPEEFVRTTKELDKMAVKRAIKPRPTRIGTVTIGETLLDTLFEVQRDWVLSIETEDEQGKEIEE